MCAKVARPCSLNARQQPGPWRQVLAGQNGRQENGQSKTCGQQLHLFFPAICHSVNGERTPRILTFRQ